MLLDEELSNLSVLDRVERLKNGLIARATGGGFDGGDEAYKALRRELRENQDVNPRLPDFVRRCSDLAQFWAFIRGRFGTYRERMEFISEEFAPAIEFLEANEGSPGVVSVTETLTQFDADGVGAVWEKALSRRAADPDGAITAARALVETVCKHILDDAGIAYSDGDDLPKLWHLTAERMNLAPNQHQEPIFKTILGNCQSIVNCLAAIRNRVGDAHGQGRQPVKPRARHAELAVNLAGALSAFLVATWQEPSEEDAPF